MPQELREQVPVIQEVLAAMDIEIVTKEGYERMICIIIKKRVK